MFFSFKFIISSFILFTKSSLSLINPIIFPSIFTSYAGLYIIKKIAKIKNIPSIVINKNLINSLVYCFKFLVSKINIHSPLIVIFSETK